MDFVASSDPIIRFAVWVGLGASMLALLLVLQVILMRFLLLHRERRKRKFLSLWRPLIVQSLVGSRSVYPSLLKANVKDFLVLWNHYQELLRGEAKEHLNQLARDISMDTVACSLLRHHGVAERLLAMMTVGHLRKESAWQPLSDQLLDDNSRISLAAAGALMKIDAEKAVSMVIPMLTAREDWPQAKVATLLKDAGATVISKPLVNAILDAAPQHLSRLIGFLDFVYSEDSSQALRKIIQVHTDPQIIAACLRTINDPRDLDLVRQYLKHPDWPVRLQAASALGRMGADEDHDRLIELLADPEWWVRYRAAQALGQLASMETEELLFIQTQQTDRFAKDILGQVLAERSS